MNEYLQTIGFATGMCPDKMRKSEFIAIMEKYSQKTYIPIVSFPATKDSDDEKDAILSNNEAIEAGFKYINGTQVYAWRVN